MIGDKPLKVEGILRIQIRDKKTGKLVFDSGPKKNYITYWGAARLMNAYDGGGSISGVLNTVNLYYTGAGGETPVATLTGSWGSRSTGAQLSCTLTAQDTSTASYTFRYLGLFTGAVNGKDANYHVYDYGSNVTKGSNNTITVTWTINIPYT